MRRLCPQTKNSPTGRTECGATDTEPTRGRYAIHRPRSTRPAATPRSGEPTGKPMQTESNQDQQASANDSHPSPSPDATESELLEKIEAKRAELKAAGK